MRVLTQINEVAQVVNEAAKKHPGNLALAAMQWAIEDVANLAHSPRLRPLFEVPATDEQAVTPVTPVVPTQDLPESERCILAYVQEHPGTIVADVCDACGYSRNTTSVVLRTLMQRGQIRRQAGRPARWWPRGKS